jgi:hypothetical protein
VRGIDGRCAEIAEAVAGDSEGARQLRDILNERILASADQIGRRCAEVVLTIAGLGGTDRQSAIARAIEMHVADLKRMGATEECAEDFTQRATRAAEQCLSLASAPTGKAN